MGHTVLFSKSKQQNLLLRPDILLLRDAQGLEDQLLAEVVRQERPELEEQRDRLVVSIAADKQQLQELEVGAGRCLSVFC